MGPFLPLVDLLCQTLKFIRKELPLCMQDGCWPFPLSYQKGIKEIRGVGAAGPLDLHAFLEVKLLRPKRGRDCLPATQDLAPQGIEWIQGWGLRTSWGVDLETKPLFLFFSPPSPPLPLGPTGLRLLPSNRDRKHLPPWLCFLPVPGSPGFGFLHAPLLEASGGPSAWSMCSQACRIYSLVGAH